MLIDLAGPRVPSPGRQLIFKISSKSLRQDQESPHVKCSPTLHDQVLTLKKNPSPLHPTQDRQEVPETAGSQYHPVRRAGSSKNLKLYGGRLREEERGWYKASYWGDQKFLEL